MSLLSIDKIVPLLALSALLTAGAPACAQPSSPSASSPVGTQLTLLGTAAGMTSWRGIPTGGPSTAIKVNGEVYVVDFGRGWEEKYYESGLATYGIRERFGGLENLRAGFITHLHGDHTVGLAQLVIFGSTDGLAKRKVPMQIYGPGPRGAMYTIPDHLAKSFKTINPSNPTPGTEETFSYLYKAYATTLNNTMAATNFTSPELLFSVHDIKIPASVNASASNPHPEMQPFKVYADENVTVTATLVSHGEMFPSFAYRFDTADASIVFSGDTTYISNLTTLSRNADILVTEVLSEPWVNRILPEPRNPGQQDMANHMFHNHITERQVGETAAEAKVKALVLSHIAPATLDESTAISGVRRYYGGSVYMGQPLMSFRIKDHKIYQ